MSRAFHRDEPGGEELIAVDSVLANQSCRPRGQAPWSGHPTRMISIDLRLTGYLGKLVGFVRMLARCSAADVHALLIGFDDYRKDRLPVAGLRIVVGMTADGTWMAFVVLKRSFHRFQTERPTSRA